MSKTYTDSDINALAEPLFQAMASRVPADDIATMRRAFEFAKQAHAPQKRKSGEPYIIHPIAVARIVGEELQLGTNAVCAAFLHDVVEDTDYTNEDIEERFGKDIAFLVKVVTKTKKERYENSKQVDNFRQMLDSVKYDIRALLVKLADRLHNMRTLASMRPDKQMKIAGETDYFYAPLANRLGLYDIKTELENLSFKYRCPREYSELKIKLEKERKKIDGMLYDFKAKLRHQIDKTGISADIEITTRKPYSIRRKMATSNTDFSHLEEIHCVNIIFDTPQGMSEKTAALQLYSAITDVFEEKPHSVSNYIDHPKENGYQSLHVHLLADNGHWQEVHISSRRMHRVQKLGCVADIDERNIKGWINKLKSTLQDIAVNTHEVSFMDGVVSSFYKDDMTVFSSDGKAVSLPQKATALDFAFEVYGDRALNAKYAVINGKVKSLKETLVRGDLVEISMDKRCRPAKDYIDHVITFTAKKHLAAWLKTQEESKLQRCPHCHPIPGDEVIGFKRPEGKIEVHKRDCPTAISIASQDGDSVVAVDFKADGTLYPASIHIMGVDRIHLMCELIDCISNRLKLPITSINVTTKDNIVNCDLDFMVHSYRELQGVIYTISLVPGIDEVSQNQRYE